MFRKLLFSFCVTASCMFTVLNRKAPLHASELRFPTAGVAVDVPEGLDVLTAGGPNVLAVLVQRGKSNEAALYRIVLEITPSKGEDLKSFADRIALRASSQVADAQMAAQPAVEVIMRSGTPEAENARILITENAGYFYLVSLRSRSADHGGEEYRSVTASMQLFELEKPVDHLELSRTLNLFSGAVNLRVPQIFREYPSGGQENAVAFGVYNYADRREEFFLQSQLLRSDGEKPLRDVAADFAETIAEKFNLREDMEWKVLTEQPLMMTSNLFEAQISLPNRPPQTQLIRYAVFRLPTGHLVLIQFGVTGATASAARSYDKCIDSICESIKVAPNK